MAPRPTWLDQFNFITFYLWNSCDIDVRLYFESGAEATGRLAVALLVFDMGDVARSFFRPKGPRTGRHGRRGRKGGRRGAIPEVSDVIARNVDGEEVLPNRRVDAGTRHMWRLDGWGQKHLYRFMILNVATDYWVDWNTAIIKSPAADCPNIARLVRTGSLHYAVGNFWKALSLPNLIVKQNIFAENGFGCALGAHKFTVILSGKVRNNSPLQRTGEYQVRLNFTSGEHLFQEYSERVTLTQGQEADLIATARVVGPAELTWEMFKNVVGAGSVEGFFQDFEVFVYQVGD